MKIFKNFLSFMYGLLDIVAYRFMFVPEVGVTPYLPLMGPRRAWQTELTLLATFRWEVSLFP